MKLKYVKMASLFLTLIPLVCLIMFSQSGNPVFVTMAVVSVGAQFMLRRKFWVCPYCKNPLGRTDGDVCPYCGRQIKE